MNVAVLTLTRDRLAYSQHCFATLSENAGIEYDHYVLDQGSTDGTQEWLLANDDLDVTTLSENVGICKGLNLLLDEAINAADYDVIVRFDNDCEVLQPGTLETIAQLALDHDAILAPRVLGLRNPPEALATFSVGDDVAEMVHHLGGIFMAIPATLFSEHGYRYDESRQPWEGDELICPWWVERSGRCGYVQGWSVNHYLTTDGQVTDQPAYFERRVLEGGPAR